MNSTALANSIIGKPWAIEPEAAVEMFNMAARIAERAADPRFPDEVETFFGSFEVEYFEEVAPGVARVPFFGAGMVHPSMIDRFFGGATDYVSFQHGIQKALEDDSINTIIADIHSPGGTVTGAFETARVLRDAASQKEVIGFTQGQATSAAQAMIAACDEVIATPGAVLGSIGVIFLHVDVQEALKMEGKRVTVFEGGNHKAMNSGLRDLTRDEGDAIQDRIEEMHEQFKAAMREYRPALKDEHMEALTYYGDQAQEIGLVDTLVDSFSELLDRWR